MYLRMLTLHDLDGVPMYLNPLTICHVQSVEQSGLGLVASIHLVDGGVVCCQESAATVSRGFMVAFNEP